MKVLVVDDDSDVRRVVRRALEREGFELEEAADGVEALAGAARERVDIAVLDLHLPGMSGLDVLAQLRRQTPDVYVVMLTGAGSEADRVLGLVSGADDYIVKPFSARELAARLLAVRRRRSQQPSVVVDVGGLRIDPDAREVTLGGEPIDLTRREFDLLNFLASNPGRTFTRAQLLDRVWQSSAQWQSEKTVTEHVRRLRAKTELDPTHPTRIKSVIGIGYRFEAGVPLAPEKESDSGSVRAESQDASLVLVGTTIVHASQPGLELLGASNARDVVGREAFDFVAPQSLGAIKARYEGSMQGRSSRAEVITLVRLDGTETLVEVSTIPVTWQGEPAVQVVFWDVAGDTARLQELATGIRTEVPEAIVIADAQLRIQSFNTAAEQLYGWREEEVLGRTTMEVMPWVRDDLGAEAVRETFQRDGRWHGEVVQRRRDGSTVTVLSSSTLLRDSAGDPVGVVTVNRPIDPRTGDRTVHRAAAEAALVGEIGRGVDRDEFVLHYQPVVSLADGQWSGAEALVRWQHPDRGLLSPDAFIDAAERSGAIVELGQQILDKACAQGTAWRSAGHDLHVSVNLSARQLGDPALFDRLSASLGRSSLPPDRLWLEITETALILDLDDARRVLHRVAGLGVRIAIDDFGTGWSSLTYLREFPIGSLKIDQRFVSELGENSADTAIVNSILALGRELDLLVIAEGIETPAQRKHLLDLGCRLGQGFLFARPGAADALDPGRSG